MTDPEKRSNEATRMVENPNDGSTANDAEFYQLGAAPREISSAKSWPSGKPPGGKLPVEASPQAKAADKPK